MEVPGLEWEGEGRVGAGNPKPTPFGEDVTQGEDSFVVEGREGQGDLEGDTTPRAFSLVADEEVEGLSRLFPNNSVILCFSFLRRLSAQERRLSDPTRRLSDPT